MTAEEREESARTYYIKHAGPVGALRSHLKVIASRPLGYVRGFIFALRLAGTDLFRALYAFFYFIEAVILGRWMEELDLSHVHVHFANPAAQVALIASRIFPIRYSLTVHGPDEFYDMQGLKLAEKISGATFICCISHFAISQLKLVSNPSEWHKFKLAPLGVDPRVFTPRPLQSSSDFFEILCVGRLVPAKGQHVLIDALDRLLQNGAQIRLRLVGDGPERDRLENEAVKRGLQEHIVFEGNVNQDRIRELYRSADVFVLASFAEGVPVVLMEAMASGIPCISTYVAGIPQLIRNGIEGLLVAPSDASALAFAIERLVKDPNMRVRLAASGRARILKDYNLEPNVLRLAKIFSSSVNPNSAAVSK